MWKSEGNKQKVRALFATDAARETVNKVLSSFILQPFPRKSYFMVPVESRVVKINPRPTRFDEPRYRKIILLRCGQGESLATFEAAVIAYPDALAKWNGALGVSIDLRREAATTPAPADAIIFVDNPPEGDLPQPAGDAFDIVNLFHVKTLKSPLPE